MKMHVILITALTIICVLLFSLVIYKQYCINVERHESKQWEDLWAKEVKLTKSLTDDIDSYKNAIKKYVQEANGYGDTINQLNQDKLDFIEDIKELKQSKENLTNANIRLRSQNSDYFAKLNTCTFDMIAVRSELGDAIVDSAITAYKEKQQVNYIKSEGGLKNPRNINDTIIATADTLIIPTDVIVQEDTTNSKVGKVIKKEPKPRKSKAKSNG